MGDTAYLLLLCQMTDKPPYLKFLEAGVYSERHPTTMSGYLFLYLTEDTGTNSEEARANVLRKAKLTWGDEWVQGILSAGIGVIR